MRMIIRYLLISIIFTLISCNNKSADPAKERSQGDVLIDKCIAAHGGAKYDNVGMQFRFRKGIYSFDNHADGYTYTRQMLTDSTDIVDTLTSTDFRRYVNGTKTAVDSKSADKYAQSINSVIYFATLPHKLGDDAVIKKYVSDVSLDGKTYHAVQVTFLEEGGGQDHDDVFYYWLDSEDDTIAFLAYSYAVNGGGVRFRSHYNRRVVGGIVFQDYINYKADVGTALADLPRMWKDGQLKELSRIETEEIAVLK